MGLYESIDASGTSGVVVRSDTDAAGTHGARITPQAAIEQIIPILPLEQTDRGLRVEVDGRETFVPRATAH